VTSFPETDRHLAGRPEELRGMGGAGRRSKKARWWALITMVAIDDRAALVIR
jgi:hypothetical protein